MKHKNILHRSRGYVALAGALLGSLLMAGCDTFETDIAKPEVKVSGDEVYVLAEGETVIDLNALVSANFSGRLSVTEFPTRGKLQAIADGLLRYAPNKGLSKTRDRFELTVFAPNDEVLSKDTVYINIETDSTQLPCNIYPRPDYVSGFDEGESVAIDVLDNDILCGKSATIQIFQPVPGIMPRHGTASVDGPTVIYTPGASFTGTDTLIYKVINATNPSSVAYGFVYINRDSVCSFTLADDSYQLDTTATNVYTLPVFANDALCDSLDMYEVSVVANPDNGTVTFTGRGFTYRPRVPQSTVSDAFIYAVRQGNRQQSARVSFSFRKGVTPCTFQAMSDTVDISALSTSLVYLDVLGNDQLCDSLKTITITRAPKNGTAFIDSSTKRIGYNRVIMKSDSLQYEICNGVHCSKATAYIKQQD